MMHDLYGPRMPGTISVTKRHSILLTVACYDRQAKTMAAGRLDPDGRCNPKVRVHDRYSVCQVRGRPAGSCARAECDACEVRSLTFCGDLGHDAMSAVAAIVSKVDMPAHALLAEEGERSVYVYNVTAGSAKLYKSLPDGRTQVLDFFTGRFSWPW
ncbi:hypothetical protein ACFQ4K_26205 [Tistrella bauzanensis]